MIILCHFNSFWEMVLIYKIFKLSSETQFNTSYGIFKACQMFEIDFELFKGLLVIEYILWEKCDGYIITKHITSDKYMYYVCHIYFVHSS